MLPIYGYHSHLLTMLSSRLVLRAGTGRLMGVVLLCDLSPFGQEVLECTRNRPMVTTPLKKCFMVSTFNSKAAGDRGTLKSVF